MDRIAELLNVPLPRPTKLTGTAWVLLIFSLFFFATGVIVGALNQQQLRRNQLLESDGVRTTALVIRRWRSGRGNNSFMMSYRFHADLVEVRGSSQMVRQAWFALHAGDQVPVLYLAPQPDINKPVYGADGAAPLWAGWLLAVVLALPAAISVVQTRREIQLISAGTPVAATVTNVKPGAKGSTIVYYEFKLPSGETAAGRATRNRARPKVGEPVCILYDPANSGRSCLYPSQFVKLRSGG